MEKQRLGAPLFTRTYHHGDGRELVVRLWQPDNSDGPLFCWFQIGDGNLHRCPGADPLEALLNAMKTIGMLLGRMRETDPQLCWKAALEDGDLGLPAFYPEDKKEA